MKTLSKTLRYQIGKKGIIIALDVMIGILILISVILYSFYVVENHSESVFTSQLYLQQTAADASQKIFFMDTIDDSNALCNDAMQHRCLLSQAYLTDKLTNISYVPSHMKMMLSIDIYDPDGHSILNTTEANTFALKQKQIASGGFQFLLYANTTLQYIGDVKYYIATK